MKKRSESNFGLHFDFHADGKTKDLGKNFRAEDLDYLLSEVRPDFIQCDTKGHPGFASYFSSLGNTDPCLKVDLLAEWQKVAHKYDIALLSHYSGIWDHKASEEHPAWRQYDENGVWTNENSVFSDYADELLIPQLKELAARGVNGAWVDAECWAVKPDFSACALAAYKQAEGKTPAKEGESFEEYKNFCRRGFFAYVKKYVDAIHAEYPDFEIASNWMYTSFCPEEPSIGVDFISGDYDAADSLNTARFEARCLPRQGKPWDLMAWAFNIQNGIFVNKSAEQLLQEIAVPLSLGGSVQIYNQEKGGNVQRWVVPVLKKAAQFARRYAFLHRAEVVPQIGILFSNAGFYYNKKWLFSKYEDANVSETTGVALACVDAGYGTDVLFTHNALRCIDGYPVLVLPDWPVIEPELKERLAGYVRRGGKLVLIGANSLRNTADVFGYEIGKPFEGHMYVEYGGALTGIITGGVACGGGEMLGKCYADNNMERELSPWCVKKQYGEGEVYAIPFAFGAQYRQNYGFVLTDILRETLASAFAAPLACLYGRRRVDVTVLRKDGKTFVTLLNRSGDHENARVRAFDDIPALYDVEIEVPFAVKEACEADTGEPLPMRSVGKKKIITVPRLDLFCVLELKGV